MRPDLRVLGLTSWVVVHDSLSMRQIRKFSRPRFNPRFSTFLWKDFGLRVVRLKLANCTFDLEGFFL